MEIKGIPVKNFNEYIEIVSDFGDGVQQDLCLFRGQPYDKPLIPVLGRLPLSEKIATYERKVFDDFVKRYQAHSAKTYGNDFDLLALGQHFGLPTRLLDWTESALVALWFATEKDTLEEYGVVWMFCPEDNEILNTRQRSPFEIGSTKVFCPNHISERITAQSGWFTCHALTDGNEFRHFEILEKYKEKLIKILIPKQAFAEIRVKLNMLGLNSATVYPDLNGLCRHLKWKHMKAERF